MTAGHIHGMKSRKRRGKLGAQSGIPGRLMFYGFSNGPGQYVSERCLVQPLYSSEVGGDHPHVAGTVTSSLSFACKANCSPEAESHAISACLQITDERLDGIIAPGLKSHSEPNSFHTGCPRLHSSSPCLLAEAEL